MEQYGDINRETVSFEEAHSKCSAAERHEAAERLEILQDAGLIVRYIVDPLGNPRIGCIELPSGARLVLTVIGQEDEEHFYFTPDLLVYTLEGESEDTSPEDAE